MNTLCVRARRQLVTLDRTISCCSGPGPWHGQVNPRAHCRNWHWFSGEVSFVTDGSAMSLLQLRASQPNELAERNAPRQRYPIANVAAACRATTEKPNGVAKPIRGHPRKLRILIAEAHKKFASHPDGSMGAPSPNGTCRPISRWPARVNSNSDEPLKSSMATLSTGPRTYCHSSGRQVGK